MADRDMANMAVADFPMSDGVVFSAIHPSAVHDPRRVTLAQLRAWLNDKLDVTAAVESALTISAGGYPPQLGHARI